MQYFYNNTTIVSDKINKYSVYGRTKDNIDDLYDILNAIYYKYGERKSIKLIGKIIKYTVMDKLFNTGIFTYMSEASSKAVSTAIYKILEMLDVYQHSTINLAYNVALKVLVTRAVDDFIIYQIENSEEIEYATFRKYIRDCRNIGKFNNEEIIADINKEYGTLLSDVKVKNVRKILISCRLDLDIIDRYHIHGISSAMYQSNNM